MRLCLVTREYPALGSHGGIGTYTQNLARGLAARGHHVTVIARAAEPTSAFFEGGVGIEPVVTPDRWRLPVGNRFVGVSMRLAPFAIAAAKRFRQLDRECPQDLVEIPEYEGWGLGVAMAARCPVVVRLHSHSKLVRRLNGSRASLEAHLIAGLEAMSIRAGDAVLANSHALAEAMACDYDFPRERVEVLPLGIDTRRFAPSSPQWLRTHLGLPQEAQILLYV
ncbi:MAG TPA: glycosyltransferase family 4 protein, partial [Oscillatoriaceae cyanobacterium]